MLFRSPNQERAVNGGVEFWDHLPRVQVDEDGIAIQGTQGEVEPRVDFRIREDEHLRHSRLTPMPDRGQSRRCVR